MTVGPQVGPVSREREATFAQTIDYLLGRQSPNGGFCFYRAYGVEEPNLFDTYHAVAALRRLAHPVPRQRALLGFLGTFAAHRQQSALYFRVLTLRHLERVERADIEAVHGLDLVPPPVPNVLLSAALQRLYEGVRLRQLFAEIPAADAGVLAARLRILQHDGGFGDKPNLADTAAALSVLAMLDAIDPGTAASARRFVDDMQVVGFGFTLTPDSLTPGLNVIRAGITACDVLGLPVRFAGDIEHCVLACAHSDGGFARVPGALREIESTHHAVAILQRLAAGPATTGVCVHE